MQHEAALGTHRAAGEHGLGLERAVRRAQIQLLEQAAQAHVERTVDDNTERALVIVFADQRDGRGKVRVLQARHGD